MSSDPLVIKRNCMVSTFHYSYI